MRLAQVLVVWSNIFCLCVEEGSIFFYLCDVTCSVPLCEFWFFWFLGRYVIQNVAAQKDGEKSKVKVKVRVNTHGIFSVSTASMVEPVKSEDSEDVGVETEVETQDQRPADNSNDVS